MYIPREDDGTVKRRDETKAHATRFSMRVQGERPRGRPWPRLMDTIRRDMRADGGGGCSGSGEVGHSHPTGYNVEDMAC